jgi:hypothetical protein
MLIQRPPYPAPAGYTLPIARRVAGGRCPAKTPASQAARPGILLYRDLRADVDVKGVVAGVALGPVLAMHPNLILDVGRAAAMDGGGFCGIGRAVHNVGRVVGTDNTFARDRGPLVLDTALARDNYLRLPRGRGAPQLNSYLRPISTAHMIDSYPEETLSQAPEPMKTTRNTNH